jgi:hypothetical protein
MKKLRMWAVLAFVSFLIGGSVQLRKPISNVVLKNVEALASVIESGEYVRCYDSGKVDCLNEIDWGNDTQLITCPDHRKK